MHPSDEVEIKITNATEMVCKQTHTWFSPILHLTIFQHKIKHFLVGGHLSNFISFFINAKFAKLKI